MPQMNFKWLICGLVLALGLALSSTAAAQPAWETGDSRPEDITVKLVTFSPGDDVVAWFGHTALVVEDARHNQQRLYNYGMFSFGDGMLAKFAMGRLWFWVGQAPVLRTYEHYKNQNRDVRVLELNLSPKKSLELAEFLAENVQPENRDYLYHHYFDNCSTRIRDAIDEAIDGQMREASSFETGQTFRDHTRRHSAHSPGMEMLLMFLMNDDIDDPVERWDEMFLPEELEEVVKEMEYENEDGETVPLVREEVVYYESDREPVPDEPPTRWPVVLLVGLAVAAGAVGVGWRYFSTRARSWRVGFGLYNAVVGLAVGVPGLALFIMWVVTDHEVTFANENLLLGNPLTLLVAPLGLALALGSERAEGWLRQLWMVLAALGLALLPLKLVPVFDQNNLLPALLILPVLVGFGFVWWTSREKSARRNEA
jgi:hypothetical protein